METQFKFTGCRTLLMAALAAFATTQSYAAGPDYALNDQTVINVDSAPAPAGGSNEAIFADKKVSYVVHGMVDADPEAAENALIAQQLHDSQPFKQKHGLQRKLWFVTAELLGAQMATLAILSTLPPEATGWGKGSFQNIIDHAIQGPHFDTDPPYWNFLAHPFVGSEYYLLARNRNATWWQSLLYSAGMSVFWEYVTEGFFERPSVQDLIITPVAGAVLGELRYQAKEALIDPKTGKADATWKKILIVILDPMNALTSL